MIGRLANAVRVRRRWLPWLLVGLVLVVVNVCVVGCVALRSLSSFVELGTTLNDELTNEQIEQLIEAKLPPSTNNVHSYYTEFMGYYAEVRFDIDAADAPQFIVSTPFTSTWQTTDNPLGITADRPWWQPSNAHRFQWTERDVGGSRET
jgi:hypothetical protein